MSAVYAETTSEVDRLKAQVAKLKRELSKRPNDPSHYPVPKQLTFCGQEIKFDKPDFRRRFEKEIIRIIRHRAQVQLYINRATATFPVIEELAGQLNTCSDLKYVAVVESALKPRAVSHAKATGWWQFMPNTARGFRLQMNAYLDERSDLYASTRAALTYLTRLNKRFDSWLLAMAGYNTGPGRLKRSSKSQKQGDFWSLDLYTEAERYSPRVLAMYHVLTHLKEYDFGRGINDGWPQEPLKIYQVTLKVSEYKRSGSADPRVYLKALALSLKMSLRDLKRYNPHLIGERLPIGVTFNLYLPPAKGARVKRALGATAQVKLIYTNQAARALPQSEEHTPDEAPRPISVSQGSDAEAVISKLGGTISGMYQVRSGDQLWQIAARARLSVTQLRRLNGLSPLSVLRAGQKLKLKKLP